LIAAWGVVSLLPGLGIAIGTHEDRPLAKVVHVDDVEWSEGSEKFREWDPLYEGDSLKLQSGMVELVIDNSVQIVLKGPADFELLSSRKAVARSGKLVARVGPEAVGFEIRTPHAVILDQGTAFSVT